MGAGKFGHNKTTAAEIADKAPENRVGDACHGGQHGRGRDRDVSDGEVSRETHKYSLASRYWNEAAARRSADRGGCPGRGVGGENDRSCSRFRLRRLKRFMWFRNPLRQRSLPRFRIRLRSTRRPLLSTWLQRKRLRRKRRTRSHRRCLAGLRPLPRRSYVEPWKPVIRKNKPILMAKAAPAPATSAPPPPPSLPQPAPYEAPATPELPATPAAEPQPAPRRQVTLPSGMTIPVRLTESLSSDRKLAGDTFDASLAEPLVVEGLVIAERGARASGRVVGTQRAGRVGGTYSSLELELTSVVTSDGQRRRALHRSLDEAGRRLRSAAPARGEDRRTFPRKRSSSFAWHRA